MKNEKRISEGREYRLSVAAGKLENRKARRLRIGAAEDRGLESSSPGHDAAVSANNADKPGLASALRQTKAKAKRTDEEYTQVLEQMILTITGMELEELHEAVGGRLTEMAMTAGQKVNGFIKGLYK